MAHRLGLSSRLKTTSHEHQTLQCAPHDKAVILDNGLTLQLIAQLSSFLTYHF